MEKRKIIIDTDPGHDDALAIMLIEKSGLFDIQAITTVAGNSTLQNVTNNARYILDLIGSDAPLYSGAATPLEKELIQADVHGESGLDGVKIIKEERLIGDASRRIIEIVKKYPKQVSILAIGPLTNIAKALIEDNSIAPLVQEIVIMGGAITVPGNKNCVAEFNIFVDPDAADIVFRSEMKKTLVPLDVCNDVFLTLEDFKKLEGSYLYIAIWAMMGHYIKAIYTFENTSGALMYDPLAAYFLINPSAFLGEVMDVRIETESKLTRGMTVADRRIWGEKCPNIFVANSVNREAFERDFLEILGK